jgi:hypothetical protein
MVPAPNFIAGLLIGIANDIWWAIPISSIAWSIVFCLYVTFTESERRKSSILSFAERGQRLFLGSPTMTFYLIEFITAFTTSFLVGIIVFGIKGIL